VLGNRWQRVALMEEASELDLSIMGRPPRELATRSESFARHPRVFIAPPGHPLLQRPQAPVAGLAAYAFIAREQGSGTRAAMAGFFSEHRFEPRIAMEMSSNETIKQALIAGTPEMRTWNAVHLGSRVLSHAADTFRYFMIEQRQAFPQAHDAPLLGPAPHPAGHPGNGRRRRHAACGAEHRPLFQPASQPSPHPPFTPVQET
jgi:DNA-binding transcriptional LysR family regulator